MCWASHELSAQSNSVSTLDQVILRFMTSCLGKAGFFGYCDEKQVLYEHQCKQKRKVFYSIQSKIRQVVSAQQACTSFGK